VNGGACASPSSFRLTGSASNEKAAPRRPLIVMTLTMLGEPETGLALAAIGHEAHPRKA
jgi:hypothetical protein